MRGRIRLGYKELSGRALWRGSYTECVPSSQGENRRDRERLVMWGEDLMLRKRKRKQSGAKK